MDIALQDLLLCAGGEGCKEYLYGGVTLLALSTPFRALSNTCIVFHTSNACIVFRTFSKIDYRDSDILSLTQDCFGSHVTEQFEDVPKFVIFRKHKQVSFWHQQFMFFPS